MCYLSLLLPVQEELSSVTFFLLEESDRSCLGASPLSLVVGFRKNGCRRVL